MSEAELNATPERDPADKWLDQYREQHATLTKRATLASETTRTLHWMANYQSQRKLHADAEARSVGDISSALESIKLSGTNEDLEKRIKDAVKDLAEERERYTAWYYGSIENCRRAADELTQHRDKVLQEARKRERENPLIERDFGIQVAAIVREDAHWATATWDEETGQVVMN